MSFKRKSLYTVKQATALAFSKMPVRFNGLALVTMARALTARPSLYDGTIFRRLRELREADPVKYGYVSVDPDLSLYEKKELETVQA